MALHSVEAQDATLHGHFSRDLPPILTIDSGDTVQFQTLDAAWHVFDSADPFERPPKYPGRDRERDPGHALCGPIAVRDAKPGMVLEVRLKTIRTGAWGWAMGGGYPSAGNNRLGLADAPEHTILWALNPNDGTARSQSGYTLHIRPFMGILGMPPDEPGRHSTIPPRFCGGNIDCKELVAGSTLYLPIAVDGGLFSTGDGHAIQGDGEVAGPALECPIERVEMEFVLHPSHHLSRPRARTSVGWITFGFHEDLNEAAMIALGDMLDLMQELHGFERKEALALASLLVDLRVTQVVNGVRGVHAVLRDESLDAKH